MPRQFITGGTTPRLDTGIGAFGSFTFGPATLAVVARVSDASSSNSLFRIGGASLSNGRCGLLVDATSLRARSGNSLSTSGITVTAADGWVLLAITKASGNVQVRFHKYVFATNTWTRATAGSNLNNSTVMVDGTCFSESQDSHIDVAAAWDRVLTDADLDRLIVSLKQWIDSAPYGLWRFDQEFTTQRVADWTSNGSNQDLEAATAPSAFSSPLAGCAAPITVLSSAALLLAPAAITSLESVPSPTVLQAPHPLPSSIASGEAFGTPTLVAQNSILPGGIASGEVFGPLVVTSPRKISPIGIPGADQPGSPSVGTPSVGKKSRIRLHGQGIASQAAVGTPTITGGRVTPTGIISREAFGTPSLTYPQTVQPTSIASAELVAHLGVFREGIGALDGIPSEEVVPAPTVSWSRVLEPTGITSLEAVGEPTLVTLAQDILPEGFDASGGVGTPTITLSGAGLHPTSIASLAAVGTPTITIADFAPVQPSSIISREAFGLPLLIQTLPSGAPVRSPTRLYDPTTGLSYAWAINPTSEDSPSLRRQYEAGAPTTVGLVRQQGVAEPLTIGLRGTILDPAQKAMLDTFCEANESATLIFEDYAHDVYEVVITSWDPRLERALRNPVTGGLVIWRYTLEMSVVKVLAGAYLAAERGADETVATVA